MQQKIIFFTLILLALSGCYPKSLKYDFGIGTTLIEGSLKGEDDKFFKSKGFILITEYYSRFIKFENESPIYVPKSRLVFPSKKGDYQVNFDLKATSIGLVFVASGYKMHHFLFHRQLGVGNLSYNVDLIKSKSWKNEFFIQIRPFIENFILDQRYSMPDAHQMFLGNWIAEIKKSFAKKI